MLAMSGDHFKELNRGKAAARSGIINTRAGKVLTPFFMPVATAGAVKGLEPSQVKATGAQMLLANTYHLHLRPGEQVVKKLGGLHSFSGWNGPMLTDSGGFQVFSLSNVRKITEEGVSFKDPKSGDMTLITPESSMRIQIALGADIIMAFDDLTGLDPAKAQVREAEAVERTHRWLSRCIAEFQKLTKNIPQAKRPLLFAIAQGGLDQKLRRRSVEFVQSQEVDGLAIGGLSVGEGTVKMHKMLEFLAPLYEPSKVHYLMGVGEPRDVRFAIEHAIDMFDCVMPTRNARHGTVWITGDKRINLGRSSFAKDPRLIDKDCDCHTCQSGYSRAFLCQMFRTGNSLGGSLASIHNLRYLQRICEEYRL
jgi:queuine tRNA-ribosyltransferase